MEGSRHVRGAKGFYMSRRPIDDTRDHWERSPIFDYEITQEKFSREYYERIDDICIKDNNPFNLHQFHFDQVKGKRVLDVGCGAGFLVRQYARNDAIMFGIDFTDISVRRSSQSLKVYGLPGHIMQANAEELPFKDNSFDFVTSWGVLHHLPSTEKGISEVLRVLKPGGLAIISLYYRNILLKPFFFPFLKVLMKVLLKAPKERDGLQHAKTPEEFVRMYDGAGNPIGRVYTKSDIRDLFHDFALRNVEQHGVPTRFLAGGQLLPRTIRRFIDRYFGICLCIEAEKIPN
jgi:2-polyprenyl-3-methyl-5-hydroxy-6-metoxy-1,4-benzoquinol methylase